ncbi:MBL fold metallo-hydrolase [Arcanobacterium canis]|uniref:MBL fold metallo-hydrolase n=1 Tax=Arcanobacterium canis TaxID=999183 RepID=A0ABY8FZJ0_9ACTO|nr:MBL fold metallo-hydrolase [Arcanobacterium canis]WFM83947.1 MBL fold metallo-hydrolase [Arcanobacterium canis]
MKLTVIGCSGSMSGPASASSSYLVQSSAGGEVLLDLGAGTIGNLQNHIDPLSLDAIALSHLHADHCGDLAAMHVYRRWHPDAPGTPIPVYAPSDADKRLQQLADDPVDEDYGPEFDFHVVCPGDGVEVAGLRISFCQAWHTVPALGMLVEDIEDGGRFFYTGDSDLSDELVAAASQADLIVSEAAFEEGRDTVRGVHMTGVRAGQLAARAADAAGRFRPDGQLVLTHLQPWTSTQKTLTDAASVFDGPIEAARKDAFYLI